MRAPITVWRMPCGGGAARYVGFVAVGAEVVDRSVAKLAEGQGVHTDQYGGRRDYWHPCGCADGWMDRTPHYVRLVVRWLVCFAYFSVSGKRNLWGQVLVLRVCCGRCHGGILRLVPVVPAGTFPDEYSRHESGV